MGELTHIKHFVSLPTAEAHSGHICDTFSNLLQHMHPIILQKISEFVAGNNPLNIM